MKNISYTNTAITGLHGSQFEFANTFTTMNIPVSENNWAFLDMQNLYQGVQKEGWKIKWDLFRQYLAYQHKVTKAVAFMGYVKKYGAIYACLKKAGFLIEFCEISYRSDGTIDGGNVDADLAAYVMDETSSHLIKKEVNPSLLLSIHSIRNIIELTTRNT